MKKTLDLLFTNLGVKNVELSSRAMNVYENWTNQKKKNKKEFYKSLLKISIGHERQYRTRQECGEKGHREEILEVSGNSLYTFCSDCGGYYTRSINDPKYHESPSISTKCF